MSNYTIEVLPEEGAIVLAVTSAYSVKRDQVEAVEQLIQLFDTSTSSMFLLVDVTKLQIGVEDLLFSSNEAARGSAVAVTRHKNLREIAVISQSKVWHLTARGLRTDAFGNIPVQAFSTLDEALTYIRNIPI